MMANGGPYNGKWFSDPSYLGYIAPNPWGPWNQIHKELAWMPAKDSASRPYQPQIAPKWLGPDGKSFWLVWSYFEERGTKEERQVLESRFREVKERGGVLRALDGMEAPHAVLRFQCTARGPGSC